MTTLTNNQFRSTSIYGTFSNIDSTNGSILANGKFQRNLTIEGNLILGKETLDTNGNAIDSVSNIQFTLNKILYSIPLRTLSYINNVTSDIQTQINNISSNNGSGSSTSSSFSDIFVSGFINGLKIKDYANGNTSFSSGNTDINGYSNTRMGYFTGPLYGYSNAVFGDQSLQNCTGYSNTAIGHNSQNSNTNNNCNTSLGCESNIINGSNNIAIGFRTQCTNCSNSIAIGNNITCSTNNQILLGDWSSSVYIPGNLSANVLSTSGNLSCNGLLSANIISTSGNLSCNGLLSANVLSTSGNLSCNGLITGNRLSTGILSFSDSLNNISPTTFGYLSGLTSNIQDQIYNTNSILSTVETRTRDISWTYGTSNVTTIGNYCNTSFLSFSQSLNNISTTTFGYLSGLTSNIQQQINNLNNTTPAGMVIAYAGTSNTLTGYLLCDGSFYNSLQYSNLFTAIGYTYGDAGNGYFKVPNYQAVFLRGSGSQFVAQPVVAGSGNPVGKYYTAPNLGTTLCDQSIQTTTSTYVNNVSTQVKTVVTGLTGNIGTYQTSNALASLSFTTANDVFNYGNDNTFPVHASVQYFIKY